MSVFYHGKGVTVLSFLHFLPSHLFAPVATDRPTQRVEQLA